MSNNTLKKKSPITLRSKSSLNSKLRCVFSCKREFFFSFSIFRIQFLCFFSNSNCDRACWLFTRPAQIHLWRVWGHCSIRNINLGDVSSISCVLTLSWVNYVKRVKKTTDEIDNAPFSFFIKSQVKCNPQWLKQWSRKWFNFVQINWKMRHHDLVI